jgi:small subunit ribosomal protein S20
MRAEVIVARLSPFGADLSSGPIGGPMLYSRLRRRVDRVSCWRANERRQLRIPVARTARTWKGARTPSALKRVRQSLRRRAVNRRTRSETKTLVQQASEIALGRSDGDGPAAVTAAISALDKAAEKGIIHPNNAARRKRRLMTKVNAAHLLDGAEATAAVTKKRTTASKTAQRKKVAAAKASKAASGKAADRPRTAAGKAKVAVTRASRESAAARRRAKSEDDEAS